MQLLFGKSKWEAASDSLATFVGRVKEAGFDATEIWLRPPIDARECIRLHKQANLSLLAQMGTAGKTVQEHLTSLEEGYLRAVECGAILVNSHTGRDIFSIEDNLRVFDRGFELAQKHGVPLVHETHRSRALFACNLAAQYLGARPELYITADFSHWMCVHESDLSDQSEALTLAIRRTRHVHGRVGFSQGPQISDPRAPEARPLVAQSVEIWKRIIAARKAVGAASLTITPEFGPPPYMPMVPFDNRPTADAWEVNCWMKDFLKKELA